MKRFLGILICALLLAGCGVENTTSESETGTIIEEFEIDENDLEEQGYTELADIAWGKIVDEDRAPTVYLEYSKNVPELSFYLISAIMREFSSSPQHVSPDLMIVWDNETYEFGDNIPDDIGGEGLIEYFPDDWHDLVERIVNGESISQIVSKQSGDIIDTVAEEFVNDYLENGVKEVISHEEYSIDGGNLILSLSKQGEELKL